MYTLYRKRFKRQGNAKKCCKYQTQHLIYLPTVQNCDMHPRRKPIPASADCNAIKKVVTATKIDKLSIT